MTQRLGRLFLLLTISPALPSCGGDTEPSGSEASGSVSSGAGGQGATARGAFSVTFEDESPVECAVSGHNAALGSVTALTKQTLVTDGTDGAAIACSVSGSGTFAVTATATQDADHLELQIPTLDASATMGTPATGSVSFASVDTASTYSGSACNFYFVPMTGEEVAAGRVWLAFDCPSVVSDQSKCAIGTSYAIFEGCAQ